MSRPPKPFAVLKSEGKSHRTKAELEQRKKAEQELLTGISLKESKEVKESEKAHEAFTKVIKVLKKIGKNDALFEEVINRYCILQAEEWEFKEKRETFYRRADELERMRDVLIEEHSMTYAEYFRTLVSLQNQITSIDKQIQVKRKMMLDIEKENLKTIQSGLRSIPKKEDKGETDPLRSVLNGS